MNLRFEFRNLLYTLSIIISFVIAIFPPLAAGAKALAGFETTFLYNLSNFNGPIRSSWAGISVDEDRNEIYLVHNNEVLVFNDTGMEIYRFGEGSSLGRILDVAVDATGDILVLSSAGSLPSILVCNFRGEPVSELELKDLPPNFSGFKPSRMIYRQKRLYLMDPVALKIVVTDGDGDFQKGYDIGSLLELEEEKRGASQIGGFSVDARGNMLITISVHFAAYIISPDGKIAAFGQPGSGPGRFNLVAGIVADEKGNYFVADRLKSVIQVYDKDFKFQMQFGHRGPRPYNLIGPKQLVLDAKGRLYISQLRNRGISVFKIRYTQP